MPQLLKPACLEPVLCNKRSHCSKKPGHRNKEQPPLTEMKSSPHSPLEKAHVQHRRPNAAEIKKKERKERKKERKKERRKKERKRTKILEDVK